MAYLKYFPFVFHFTYWKILSGKWILEINNLQHYSIYHNECNGYFHSYIYHLSMITNNVCRPIFSCWITMGSKLKKLINLKSHRKWSVKRNQMYYHIPRSFSCKSAVNFLVTILNYASLYLQEHKIVM